MYIKLDKIVCNCMSVTNRMIKEAVDAGASTLEEVQAATPFSPAYFISSSVAPINSAMLRVKITPTTDRRRPAAMVIYKLSIIDEAHRTGDNLRYRICHPEPLQSKP